MPTTFVTPTAASGEARDGSEPSCPWRLVDAVHAHASRHPDRPALVCGTDVWTYARLSAGVRRLSAHLRRRGVGPGSVVAIHLDRSATVVVCALAVQDAGAAYSIWEPTAPPSIGAERLAEAAPDLTMTSRAYDACLRARGLATSTVTGAAVPAEASPGDGEPFDDVEPAPTGEVAYVLYTSGSTGRPKGVLVSHANVAHYTSSLAAGLGVEPGWRYAHVTTLAADLGNTCVFLALWTGGTLHVVGEHVRRDPAALVAYLREQRIDVVKSTPSHWRLMLTGYDGDSSDGPLLRLLLLGGETFPRELAESILRSGVTAALGNHYGPTETTVGVTAHLLRDAADLAATAHLPSVPIGRPFGRTRLHVRTADGTVRSAGAEGELLVSGPSVGMGYLRDPAATARAFVTLDGVDGRAYRTGDRVRIDDSGLVEFLGRADRQVKVAGHRVELGEVEAGLRRVPGVRDAVAMLLPGPRPTLAAAVTTTHGADMPDERAIRRSARQIVPAHMVPDRVAVFGDFPRTSNEKVDVAAIRATLTEAAKDERADEPCDDPLVAEVRAVWKDALGHGEFGLDDEFTDVGGNSIDAIQAIAALQLAGHRVSAADFLACPTPRALAEFLRTRDAVTDLSSAADATPADDPTALSPPQRWFFRQGFAEPDRWNQAILLEIDPGVDVDALSAAFDDVARLHPMLRTAFRPHGEQWSRHVVSPVPGSTLTSSALPADVAPESHLPHVAARVQERIRITGGSLLAAHLLRGDDTALLLVACHHLAVDAVSWRLLLGELDRCYGRRRHGDPVPAGTSRTGFGAWATSVHARAESLQGDLAFWGDVAGVPEAERDPANVEGAAVAAWFRLDLAETDALARAAAGDGAQSHAALLAAFGASLAELQGTDDVVVDVEGHGRAAIDGVPDASGAVGWFTSTFPVRLAVAGRDATGVVKAAADALSRVPHGGVAYGLLDQPRRADVCFNYLGAFTLPAGSLAMRLRTDPIGPVRGAANDRGYHLKVTARRHHGELVVDISHVPGRLTDDELRRLAAATRARLLAYAGQPAGEAPVVVERGSTTGSLAYVPRALTREPKQRETRDYGAVLVTGVTGFVGAHLLRELLSRTDWTVYCLVRGRDAAHARERVRAEWSWHHPDEPLDEDRVVVLRGDMTQPRLGLSDAAWHEVAGTAGAVYHLASDTRLFGESGAFDARNIAPLRTLFTLTETGRPKDLHYVSTLAVCGEGPQGEPVAFSEDSLDIGQSFLNDYERSKFDAERLVHDFAAHGGSAFVYRLGNVSAHSRSGRFQRNAAENRMVQLLRACVKLRRVPDVAAETVVLSPVDVVARSLLEISRDASVTGGTFHVDSPYDVTFGDLFAALRRCGFSLHVDRPDGFASFFRHHLDVTDEQLALAHFWAQRPERRVVYRHARTHRLLDGLGVRFPRPDDEWLDGFVSSLVRSGALQRPARTATRPTRRRRTPCPAPHE